MTDQPTPDDEAIADSAAAEPAPEAPAPDDVPTANEYTVAFSPQQVAVGLAIVAGLVGLIVRRRRRTKGG